MIATIELVKGFLRLRADAPKNKLYLEWYNSATATWEVKVQIDAPTGIIEVGKAKFIEGLLVKTFKFEAGLPPIPPHTTKEFSVGIEGITVKHKVLICYNADMPHGLVASSAYVSADGTLKVLISNFTGESIPVPVKEWLVWAYIPPA